MAQLIIDVADDKLAFFRSLIDELENIHIVDNEDYDHIFTPEFIEELDKRSQSPRKDYTPAREIYNQLKTKIRV
jgi:hypothetical protein